MMIYEVFKLKKPFGPHRLYNKYSSALMINKLCFFCTDLQCFSCLDLRTIESDGTGSGQPDIRSAVIGALFEGSAPPSCDGHGLVNCTGVNHRCMTARTITEGVCK